MSYKTFVSLDIAVIGQGKKVRSLAKKLADVGHAPCIGWKDGGAKDSEEMAGLNVRFANIEESAADADVIIVCTPATEVREVAYLLNDVRSKIILDSSFVIAGAADDNINTINAIIAITGTPYVAKSFSCSGYQHIIKPLFKGRSIDSFVAGNCNKAKEITKILAKDIGYTNCYDFGDSTTIPLLEEMARGWHNLSLRASIGQKVAMVVVKK